jgi:hypothetical protein
MFEDLNAFYLATITSVCHIHKTHIYKFFSMLLYPMSLLYYPFPPSFPIPAQKQHRNTPQTHASPSRY